MFDPRILILLAIGVCKAFAGTVRAFFTGHARFFTGAPVRRSESPLLYWLMCANYLVAWVLFLVLAAVAWAVL